MPGVYALEEQPTAIRLIWSHFGFQKREKFRRTLNFSAYHDIILHSLMPASGHKSIRIYEFKSMTSHLFI